MEIPGTERSATGTHYTTQGLPASRRRAYWREALSRTFGAVDMKVGDEVEHGAIRTSLLGPLQAVAVEGEPHQAERSRRLVAASNSDEYVVVKHLSHGTLRVEQDARETHLTTGTLFMYDMARPVRLTVPERFRTKSLVLPRRALGLSESDFRRITAVPLGADTPLGRLVPPLVSRLVDSAATYQAHTGGSVAAHAVSLIQTLVEEQLGFDLQDTPDAARTTLLRIQAYIGEHLTDRDLTPEAIARHHHMSVRYLHKLFELEGVTVHRWIQRRRLDECRRALGRRDARDRSIAAVAHHWGFVSATHFSRSFKDAFGVSPREWRNTAGGTTQP
ncbi:helix-turn-helix domain-containing protein [Kitasatospora purpeofusca]|uniref:helix-turn-helix domain-containing protein n=1 Tax=Kitasatospora purpeofusca TaxID=67352 RepID=UPI0035E23C7D